MKSHTNTSSAVHVHTQVLNSPKNPRLVISHASAYVPEQHIFNKPTQVSNPRLVITNGASVLTTGRPKCPSGPTAAPKSNFGRASTMKPPSVFSNIASSSPKSSLSSTARPSPSQKRLTPFPQFPKSSDRVAGHDRLSICNADPFERLSAGLSAGIPKSKSTLRGNVSDNATSKTPTQRKTSDLPAEKGQIAHTTTQPPHPSISPQHSENTNKSYNTTHFLTDNRSTSRNDHQAHVMFDESESRRSMSEMGRPSLMKEIRVIYRDVESRQIVAAQETSYVTTEMELDRGGGRIVFNREMGTDGCYLGHSGQGNVDHGDNMKEAKYMGSKDGPSAARGLPPSRSYSPPSPLSRPPSICPSCYLSQSQSTSTDNTGCLHGSSSSSSNTHAQTGDTGKSEMYVLMS